MRLLSSERPKAGLVETTELGRAFDPFDPDFVRNPYPALARIQAEEPVIYAPEIDTFVVTRMETVRAVLRDSARFSAGVASDPLTPLCPAARGIITESDFDVPGLLVNNASPSHPRCRKFFGEPLKPSRLAALRPFIHETVERQIDAMIAAGPPADLATGLTWDVPALVLFRLLGVPDEDVPQVKEYADSRVILLWGRPTADDQVRLSSGAVDFFHYTSKLVKDRLENPKDDYPSDVIRQRDGDDDRATIREIIAVTFNLLFAGHETTSSASSNILSKVLSDRLLWQSIVDGSMDIGKVVDEGLRYDPPVQAWRRQALEDVELDGVQIPAGSHLLLHFAAANRDPASFEEPEAFDADRANAGQHVSFGAGAHFCLGAGLARYEIETMIGLLAKRLPSIAPISGEEPQYLPNTSFRGLRNLKVSW